jgi:hypothetical protein
LTATLIIINTNEKTSSLIVDFNFLIKKNTMGANDNPTTTREVITEYFDWRLNNRTITNRLSAVVRRVGIECEQTFRTHPTFNLHFSQLPVDEQTLNNIKNIHHEIANELFQDGVVSWSRIITLISFSALLAEHITQQPLNHLPRDLVITSIIDWTTDFIETNLQTWLQNQNSWVKKKNFFLFILNKN